MPANHPADSSATADFIADLGQRVLAGHQVTREEARRLATVSGDEIYDLFYFANKIRIRFVGRQVKFCSIVAAKVGACSEDCGYCSQSKHYKTHVAPGKLSTDEMVGAMEQALSNGANSFGIVNSGRGPTDAELDWLEPFYKSAVANGKIRPCATLGELTPEHAQRLKSMGVLRINHNLETSQRHYPSIVKTHTYEDRVRTIKVAKEAGLSICSGGIFGMGEVWEDRIDMALALRGLDVDVVPINFLNAIAGTPLYGREPQLSPLEALHIVAVYRFLLPTAELKIAGGREKILRDMQSWMFFAGGSSFLIGNYLTTFGRSAQQDQQMLADLGMPYTTFDEVEHEAEPAMPGASGSRLVALPVVS
ncbi:MAG: biotin synthase BioB [Planctomycetota bacterium]|nr:biotin synthase BioB [Planctomycetota bacterium]